MSVNTDATGRRFVQIELEVPGTPEEVWHAIATGPGISSWFMPAAVEEHDGTPASLTLTFGPGMEARSSVTTYDAPRRMVTEAAGWMPGSPPIANEWTIEARSGGVCVLRIVHSLFASTDAWDDQLEATRDSWGAFLRTLQLYLTHFRGAPCTLMQVSVPATGSESEVWNRLTAALGLAAVSVGQSWTAPSGVPPLQGVLEHHTREPYDALLRITTPGAGITALGIAGFPGGPIHAAMNFYLYGEQAAALGAQEQPRWEAFLRDLFG